RGALWRIDELLQPQALKDAAALPDRRGAAVRETRQVIEDEQYNAALLADPDSAAAWQRALAAARLAEETASQAGADAQLYLMQADRVRSEVMSVRQRLAPDAPPD
ncbi:MAG: hypothetical protein KGL53_06585, partial [Elusimicrobia bacterium]|nr:hypothetical protein [Elusimicrobiota bacterium]